MINEMFQTHRSLCPSRGMCQCVYFLKTVWNSSEMSAIALVGPTDKDVKLLFQANKQGINWPTFIDTCLSGPFP